VIVITAGCAAAFAWLGMRACAHLSHADVASGIIAPGVISLLVKLHGDGARRLSPV
jgi:hypothetical protein